jgi:hypothetical protein
MIGLTERRQASEPLPSPKIQAPIQSNPRRNACQSKTKCSKISVPPLKYPFDGDEACPCTSVKTVGIGFTVQPALFEISDSLWWCSVLLRIEFTLGNVNPIGIYVTFKGRGHYRVRIEIATVVDSLFAFHRTRLFLITSTFVM